jgi:glycine cleavage system protein P-like pyridoxal-binding family
MVLGLPAPGTTPEIASASHQGVNLAACDVDQNGAVDIDDVTALIRMLLSSSEDE